GAQSLEEARPVPAGLGVGVRVGDLGFALGLEDDQAHLRRRATLDHVGEALLQHLHLEAGDADQGFPPAHAASLARMASSCAKPSSRLVASSLSWLRNRSSAGLSRMARSTFGSEPMR